MSSPRRRYESPRRQEQAARTRRDVLAAAGTLFRDRGYVGRRCRRSQPRRASWSRPCTGHSGARPASSARWSNPCSPAGPTRADVPVEERPQIRAMIEEPNPRRQVALYAATQPGIHRRAGPLLRALRDAAETDKELRKLWDEMEAWRLDGQGRMAGMLAERGALRDGLSVEAARDVVLDAVLTRGPRPARPRAWLVMRALRAWRPTPSSASCSPTPRIETARVRRSPSRRAAPARGRQGRSGPDRGWPRARSCPRSE